MDSISQVVDDQESQPPPPPPPPPRNSSAAEGRNTGERIRGSSVPPQAETHNFMGKHRMAAAITLLHHQIEIIQEELEQLETLGESSIVCKEVISSVESVPDALLPVSKGPAIVGWDRWFQGAQGARSRKRWI